MLILPNCQKAYLSKLIYQDSNDTIYRSRKKNTPKIYMEPQKTLNS